MKNIYFDNAATTKMDEKVVEAMLPYMKENFGNASSVHKWGRDAKVFIEDAREVIAEFIGARPSEFYFTSGGTEANNFGIKGLAFNNLGKKNHIISAKIEHSSVLDSLEYLEKRLGFSVSYVKTDSFGVVNPDNVRDEITDKTFLICMMHSNNELGVINDIAALGKIAKEKGIYLHTDSVQSIGKTKFDVNELNCSTASLSAHKIYGPKGIGALYIRKDTSIDKFHHGGKQERDRRGGTENVAAIAGFKKAVEILKERMTDDIDRYGKLRLRLLSELEQSLGDKIIFNSLNNEKGLNNIINISLDLNKVKIDSDALLIKLDMNGIAVSSGSACTSGTVQPSHVLKAVGHDNLTAKNTLRISFGRYNTEDEVDYFVKVLKEMLV